MLAVATLALAWIVDVMKKAVHVIPAVVALATKAAAHPAAVQTKCESD